MGAPSDRTPFGFIKTKAGIATICVLAFLLILVAGIAAAGSGGSTKEQLAQGGDIQTDQTETRQSRVEHRTDSQTEEIPFETQEEMDATIPQGETRIKQEGKFGVKQIDVTITYTNGRETDRSNPTEEILSAPVDEIILVGTYVAPAVTEPTITPPSAHDQTPSPAAAAPETAQTPGASPSCDPNYSDCVPTASDVDCAGGSGDGPAYTQGGATVILTDKYDLDSDGNGIACDE